MFTRDRLLALISSVFHYPVTCLSDTVHELSQPCAKVPLITTTTIIIMTIPKPHTICVIVVRWCQPRRPLTLAVLSAAAYEYKHICLSYWPLSPHFLDSLLQLLTMQTHGAKHNLSFTELSLSLSLSLSIALPLSLSVSFASSIARSRSPLLSLLLRFV